ncbi:hypothetical protein JCM3770_000333 [Rhodotorula araucariae]
MDALDLEIDAYCVVCDRALPHGPASSSAAAPPPPPSFPAAHPTTREDGIGASAASTSTAPSTSHRSRASDGGAPRLKRTPSSTSTSTAGAGAGTGRSGAGGALRRNKSVGGKIHARTASHGHGHGHRSHSHANLAALAPVDTAAKGKKAAAALAERRPSKAAKEEVIEIIELDGDDGGATGQEGAAPQGIYCSDECRRVDEVRNALALAHLGAGPPSWADEPASSPHPPFDAMARRRSSGLSSISSFAPSRSNLSPIQSAVPTADVGQFDESIGAFPFPPVAPPSLSSSGLPASRSAAFSAPPSTASPAPPFLNFGARRRSRGHEVTGGYSYRPSLMERVSSSEGRATPGGGVWLGVERGFSRPTSAADGALPGPRSASAGGDAMEGRPPSALASLRSMTPLADPAPFPLSSSPARAAYQPSKTSPRAEPQRVLATQPDLATSPLARHSFLVGSAPVPAAPVARRRGPSFGEPTLPEIRPLNLSSSRPPSTGLQRRSASSASLALMGSSLGKSYEPRPWVGPKRSESTASLSGFVALGEMSTSPVPPPPVSSSSSSTVIPAGSSARRGSPAHPPSSPSSTSSYARSHSSAYSARSSTTGSSDHPLSSLGSTHVHASLAAGYARTKSQSRGRSAAGLVMTPSATSLASSGAAGECAAPPGSIRPLPSTVANAASTNPALSYLKADDGTKLPAPPPSQPPHQRSFSWQHIPTYAAYDVDAFRAARASPASESFDRGARAAPGSGTGAGLQRGGDRPPEGEMPPPPVPPRAARDRKRLFYFSDEHGAE